jgi:Predicted membrane protein
MVAGIAGYENNGSSSKYSAAFVRNLRPTNPNPHGVRTYPLDELLGPERDLLLIANTGLVIADSPTLLEYHPDAVQTADGAVLIPTGGGTPMLVSERTMVVEPSLQFAPLAREMNIDRENRVAAFIPILAGEGPSENHSLSGSVPTVTVRSHVMESQYVRMEYELSSPGYLQLSYSYYPYLRVLIDGKEVEIFPTAFGLIGLQSYAGIYTLEIVPYLSPLRRVVLAISVVGLLTLALLWLLSFRKYGSRRIVYPGATR